MTLSSAGLHPVTVAYSTADGTATVADNDYLPKSGTLTFAPGTPTTQTITIPVVGDTDVEPDETFTVNLSNPGNASILHGIGTGTILNDSSEPTISIDDVTIQEGNTPAVFHVTLSAPSERTVTVDYATIDGTAHAPHDYAFTSGTLIFSPGQSTVQTISVPIVDHSLSHNTLGENSANPTSLTFFVQLSNLVNAHGTNGSSSGTLPTVPDVPNGLVIDNNVDPSVVGHFQLDVGDGGQTSSSKNNGLTALGLTQLFSNQNLIYQYENFVDVGAMARRSAWPRPRSRNPPRWSRPTRW